MNGISAGPIKTLAASGIKGFGKILEFVENNAPLRRNVTIEQVGNVAAFLLSDLAGGVSAEIIHVEAALMPWSAAWRRRRRNKRCRFSTALLKKAVPLTRDGLFSYGEWRV